MFKKIIKIVAAVLVFILSFNCVQNVLVGDIDNNRSTMRFNGFYKTEKGSLDAILLGSSASYAYFIAPYVWHEYGVTIYPFASSAQPIQATKFLIEEARKSHPDSVYIINLAAVRSIVSQERLHILFSDWPLSMNKLSAVDYICDSYEYTDEEKIQYVFPIVTFHNRWSELNKDDFGKLYDDYKTGNSYPSFLKLSEDVGSIGRLDDDLIVPLKENVEVAVADLLDYCQEEKIKVQFIITPQSTNSEKIVGWFNVAKGMVEERGYTVLDMREKADEIGLDYAIDYYNRSHTNMHGALKTSKYLTEFLLEQYEFEDKRGNSNYAEWDEAYLRYYYECLEPNIIEADMKYFNAPVPDKAKWKALQN